MEISKFKALWSLMTGGIAGLIKYILEVINEALKKLDPAKIAQVADVVKNVSNALVALVPLLPAKYQDAAKVTIEAINKLSDALKDGNVTEQELNDEIDAIKAAIDAWKNVSK